MSEKSWKEIPIGGKILEAGNAREYKTGGWKTFRPEIDRSECINCLFCWLYCPDMAVTHDPVKNETAVNYEYCKGCGICEQVCPKKCIKMVKEER
ncbi:MAG: 4Fe-4S binding protein [Elusimicrobia bacterium]|nr:4Fe-4S binding protein [Elusimicrobiota bacterium]